MNHPCGALFQWGFDKLNQRGRPQAELTHSSVPSSKN